MVPSGHLGFTAVAGLFPAFAVIAGGLPCGFACWGVAGALGLLLLPDKFIAGLYLMALGLYPVLKSAIEQLRCLVLEWLLKLLFFNGILTLLITLFRGVFLPILPSVMSKGWILYAAGNVVFILYDLALSGLLTTAARRLKKGLRKP